jgi:hypothetical protein
MGVEHKHVITNQKFRFYKNFDLKLKFNIYMHQKTPFIYTNKIYM